jgi:hypothetical protein
LNREELETHRTEIVAQQAETKGPRFARYFSPVLEVLKILGGSGNPDEVREGVASRLKISEREQSEQLPSGSSRFDNEVAWARFYLTRAGLLDSSRRGVWSLTEKGRSTTLSDVAALQLVKDLHKVFSEERKTRSKEDNAVQELRNRRPRRRLRPRALQATGNLCSLSSRLCRPLVSRDSVSDSCASQVSNTSPSPDARAMGA